MTIDVHTHAFPDELADRAIETLNEEIPREAWAVLDGSVGDLLRSMDEGGIERSVIASIATKPKQAAAILRWSESIQSERIIPFGSVHPEGADPAADVAAIAGAGLRGVKLHSMYQKFSVDERRMWPIYGAIEESNLVLLFHAGRDIAFPLDDDRATPERILNVHRAFPDMPIIAAHMGGWKMWDEVAETLAGKDIWLETSYSFAMGAEEALGKIIERHPADRILFGTDSPWTDQSRTLQLVKKAFPDPESQRMVLRENAERLLGLV